MISNSNINDSKNKLQHKLLNNENLVIGFISYLNTKDLSNIGQTSKKFEKIAGKFNFYWQNECQNTFFSDYENTR